MNSAANLKGRLLLAIGTGDDNVHIENTVQFVQKLIEADIPYDLQIYPAENTFNLRRRTRGRTCTTAFWRSLSSTLCPQ